MKPYRAAIDAKLRLAAERCAKDKLILLLENEMACNTATGEESAAVLRAVPNQNFMLNWDPGNAAAIGNGTPYPDGYQLLPKDRIGHCHCKDVVRKADGKYDWAPVGGGIVDWVGQLQALQRNGFHYAAESGDALERRGNDRKACLTRKREHGRTAEGVCESRDIVLNIPQELACQTVLSTTAFGFGRAWCGTN